MSAGHRRPTYGKYRVVRELGRGANGVVVEAQHEWTQRHVALKVLRGGDPEANARFVRASRVAGRLVHSHVASVIDADQASDGSIYIVQELLVGETLRALLARRGRLAIEETAEILLPIMEALCAAHAAEIVHRDVRPSNVFLARLGTSVVPKLVDFGLSKLLSSELGITIEGAIVGTPAYMSPEQLIAPASIDERADVWSVAATWYECLSGRRPYEARTPADLVILLAEGTATPLRDVAPELPSALVDVIERGLERDRERRWRTMGDFGSALEASLGRERRMSPEIAVEIMAPDVSGSRPRTSELVPEGGATLADPSPSALDARGTGAPASAALRALHLQGLRAIRFAIVPTAASFDDPDLGDALTETLGLPTVVLRFPGYAGMFDALRERRVEAAWMAPAPFVAASGDGLVRGLFGALRGGRPDYVAVLLGHTARVTEVSRRALLGARAAWVDHWAAAGFLVPRQLLRRRGVDPDALLGDQVLVGSYPAVIDAIVSGAADLGGVHGWREPDGELWHPGLDHPELTVLDASGPIPSDVLAVRADLPAFACEVLTSRLAPLTTTGPGTRRLLALVGAERLATFDAGPYAIVADALRIEEEAVARARSVLEEEAS